MTIKPGNSVKNKLSGSTGIYRGKFPKSGVRARPGTPLSDFQDIVTLDHESFGTTVDLADWEKIKRKVVYTIGIFENPRFPGVPFARVAVFADDINIQEMTAEAEDLHTLIEYAQEDYNAKWVTE